MNLHVPTCPPLSLSEQEDRPFVETIVRGVRSALWKNVHTYAAGSSVPEYLLTVGIADAVAAESTHEDRARILLECQQNRLLRLLGHRAGSNCGPLASGSEMNEGPDANGRFDIVVTIGSTTTSDQIRIIEVKDHVKQASEMLQQFKRITHALNLPSANSSEIQACYFAFLGRASIETMLGNLFVCLNESNGISLDIYPRLHSHECDGEGDTIYVLRLARYKPESREAISIW